MKKFLFILLLAAGLSAQDVNSTVQNIWQHIGGKENFEAARYLEFTFRVEREGKVLVEREHLWDRYTGNYVCTIPKPKSDETVTVYLNVDTQKGTAFDNGAALTGDDNEQWVKKAYGSYINDSYWLIVPAKLEDKGLDLRLDKKRTAESRKTVLSLGFDNVGLTPGDIYWLYVNDEGRIERWQFKLQGGREGEFEWLDEKDCGEGVVLPTRKVSADGKTTISFPHVKFSKTMDTKRFQPAGDK